MTLSALSLSLPLSLSWLIFSFTKFLRMNSVYILLSLSLSLFTYFLYFINKIPLYKVFI